MHNSKSLLVFALIAVGCISASAQSPCTGNAIFTSQQCAGDAVTAAELELYTAVNQYREANGLAPLRLSPPLSRLGNRRMLDLNQNMKTITHSWSNCRYDIKDESTWPCLTASPSRLNTGYAGEGYETLYRTTGKAEPAAALAAWKKSTLHSSIILNKDMFAKMPWEEIGVAIDGQYASLWFGLRGGRAVSQPVDSGSAISLDRAISGLSRSLTSQTPEQNIWQGISADKKLKLTISGTRGSISEAQMTISAQPNTIGAERLAVIANLLKNIFPDWPDIDAWIAASMKTITDNPRGWRRKIVGDRVAEIRGEGTEGIRLIVKPYLKPKAVEMD